ncbi:MAG: HAMP domain-containing histidine kinase [Verrucomicrobia bacterium]|nr:HAMP domain-containing histidine kinase [Verrucomicrobiota bacterium]
MSLTLQKRYFVWLAALLVVFIVVQTCIFSFVEFSDWHSQKNEPLMDKMEEVVISLVLDVALLPFLLLVAWWFARWMIGPIRTISQTAERISTGEFSKRIPVDGLPDDEMTSLGRSINSAFDRYHEAVARLERFSSDASHQLRTPLAAIRTEGEVALQHERTAAEYAATIGSMLEEVNRLSRSVTQMLELARLDAAALSTRFEPVQIRSLLNRLKQTFEILAEEKGLSLEVQVDGEPVIPGIPDLLFEALANLIDNSLKVTPRRGQIRVQADSDDRAVVISVADQGPGVPVEFAERIFDRFAKATGEEVEGSGLGLAIVSEIVGVHGGKMDLVESDLGGAEFRISFPV